LKAKDGARQYTGTLIWLIPLGQSPWPPQIAYPPQGCKGNRGSKIELTRQVLTGIDALKTILNWNLSKSGMNAALA
jgi:hypothetical protein